MQAFFACRHGAVPTAGISGRAAHVRAAFLVGIASYALVQALFACRHGAVPAAGISGRAAHVGAAFLVGIASDALVQRFAAVFLLIRLGKNQLKARAAGLDVLVDQIATVGPRKRLRN